MIERKWWWQDIRRNPDGYHKFSANPMFWNDYGLQIYMQFIGALLIILTVGTIILGLK